MAPIRVGLIGLSAQNAVLAPGAWAVGAHLPGLLLSPDYEVVALANSSAESARKSIAFHGLPPATRAYGSAEELAADPDVDLVVVSVNVAKHLALAKPAILGGKDVFVEWPLGASLAEAEELTRLAREAGVKTVVGVQARADPVVAKLKEILAEGRIGKVLSSSVVACFTFIPVGVWMAGVEYYLDKGSGGNLLTITFGHFLDSFVDVLGDFASVQSILAMQHPPTVALVDMATGDVVDPAYPRTAPDHVLVQGRLESGAVASLSARHSVTAVDGTGFRWIISGTEGEIEVTLPETQWQVASPGMKLRVKVGKEGAVEEVDVRAGIASSLDDTAVNTALVYEAFAKGDAGRFATFEDALRTHRLLERIVDAAKLA